MKQAKTMSKTMAKKPAEMPMMSKKMPAMPKEMPMKPKEMKKMPMKPMMHKMQNGTMMKDLEMKPMMKPIMPDMSGKAAKKTKRKGY